MVLCVRFVAAFAIVVIVGVYWAAVARHFHWMLEQYEPMRLGLKN